MRTQLRTLFITGILLIYFAQVKANSYTWTGATSVNWSVNTNWLPNGNPGAADDVTISLTTRQPTVDAAQSCRSVTINSGNTITLSAALTIGSGGLTINGNNSLIFAGTSSASVAGSTNINNPSTLTIGSGNTITFSGAVTVNSNCSFTNNGKVISTSVNGIATGNPGTFTNSATGTITLTASRINIGGGSNITNNGKIIANSASSIITGNPVSFTNGTGSSITLTGSTINWSGGTTIVNSGSIIANASSQIITGNPNPITNNATGIISLSASTMNFIGGAYINNSGSISEVAGSSMTFNNPSYINNLTAGSTLDVSASTLDIEAGGYITNAGKITTELNSRVMLNGNPANITNNVNASFTSSATTFTMVAGSAITNTGGTFLVSSSSISCSGNPTNILNQNSGSTIGIFTLDATPVTFTGTNAINNYGTFTAKNGSHITMTPACASSSINNYGTFFAGISNSPANITLDGTSARLTNNTAGSVNGAFYVGSTSIIYPTSTSGQVINNTSCTFTLQSDNFGSAAVGQISSSANPSPVFNGIYNVERYLSGGSTKDATTGRWIYRNYRLMSSPVNTISSNNGITNVYPVSLKYLATSAIITGTKGGYIFPSTFNSTTAVGNPSLYFYREDITPNNTTFTSGNFIGVTDITDQTNYTVGMSDGSTPKISVGDGYMFFFRGDNIHSITTSPGKTKAPYVAVEPTTFTAIGYLNQGSYQPQNWVPGGGSLKYESNPTYNSVTQNNAAVRGYNLVGNPYACSIDWDTFNSGGIASSSVNPTIYVFNPITNQYNTYLAGHSGIGTGTGANLTNANIIPSGEGFYVQANNHAATITFTETCKAPAKQVASSNLLLGTPLATNAPLQYLRLTLFKDSLNYNDMLLFFKADASSRYDGLEDARYLPGNGAMVSLSSLSSDSVQLAVNTLPFPKTEVSVTRLSFTTQSSGQFTFKRGELQSIPALYEVWLMDKYKKDSLDIRANDTYIFDVDKADTNSFGNNRFEIVIRQNSALGVHLLNFTATKATGGAQTAWKTENEQNYTNFTVERSTDNGVTFAVLGGTPSSALGTYSYLDSNPINGVNLYRLKIEDLNGTITYSNAVQLSYSATAGIIAGNISVYPNPASGVINLSINQSSTSYSNLLSLQQQAQTTSMASAPATGAGAGSLAYNINIVNMNGNVVKTASSSTANWQDNVSSLQPGTYVIQVTNQADNSVVGKSLFVKL